jgi:hypothetical protein
MTMFGARGKVFDLLKEYTMGEGLGRSRFSSDSCGSEMTRWSEDKAHRRGKWDLEGTTRVLRL